MDWDKILFVCSILKVNKLTRRATLVKILLKEEGRSNASHV